MRVSLDLPPGINSDDTTFSGSGGWSDGSNARFWMGKPQTIGPWEELLSGLDGVCRNIHAWMSTNGTLIVALGTNTKLYVYMNSEVYDITPVGLVAGAEDSTGGGSGYGAGGYGEGTWSDPALVFYARTWSFDNYGEWLMANPRGGTIYKWEGDPGTPAAALTNAPANVTFMMVTPERQILALGCNEETSGDFNQLCIRGSDIEDITDWTTGTSDNVFEHILDGSGWIVAGGLMAERVAVWTSQSVYLGTFLGQPGQAYRFDRVGDNCGLVAVNAVQIDGQTAFWVGTEYDFHAWSPGGVPNTIPCPISADFKANVVRAQRAKIAAAPLSQFSELWWYYPDARDGTENSRYLALGTKEGSGWFRGIMARTAAIDAGTIAYPLRATADGFVYSHEIPTGGEEPDWFLKFADQSVEEGGRRMLLRKIEPDFKSQANDIALTLEVRSYPQAIPTEVGPYALAPGALKVDLRAAGRIVAGTFEGTGFMRMGKPVFDTVPMGRRG